MESFYGGRPGNSFIIVKSFSSVNEMKQNFKKGMNYNEVYFDQYVIINNSANPQENGKVYRRGYDLSNGLGGAEYVCSIQGPAGSPTSVELYPYNKFNSINDLNPNDNSQINHNENNYPIYGNSENNDEYDIEVPYQNGIDAFELIPGAEKNNETNEWTYNDNIIFRYYQIQDINKKKTILRIGFKIPYPIFDFSISAIEAGQQQVPQIIKIDNGEHKFFNKWQIKLPLAKKGDSITKIEVIQLKQDNTNENIDYSWYSDVESEIKDKKLNDMRQYKVILVATIAENGQITQSKQYYISDFDLIKNIDINSNGYLIFTLPNGTEISSSGSVLPSLNSMSLNDYGEYFMNWVDPSGTQKEIQLDGAQIKWIKEINYTENGLQLTWNIKDRNENGEVLFDTNNNPIRKKQTIPIFGNNKLITGIKVLNGSLCETHIGIQDQMSKLNSIEALEYIPDDSNTYYKKIVDIEKMIIDAINQKTAQGQVQSFYTKGTYVHEIVKADILISFATNEPYSIGCSCEITLPKLIPSKMNYIQTAGQIRRDIKNGQYDTSCIAKIYLADPGSNILESIYGGSQSAFSNLTTYEERLEHWQNLNYNDLNSDVENSSYEFYAGIQGDDHSRAALHAITPNLDQPLQEKDVYSNSTSTNLERNLIIDEVSYILTGRKDLDDSFNNIKTLRSAKIWTVQQKNNKLLLTGHGRGGSGWSKMADRTFTIPVMIEIDNLYINY